MNVIDTKVRKPAIILSEINALDRLITRRLMWLNRPENKQRGTYQAVKVDTDQMEVTLEDLRKELQEANTIDGIPCNILRGDE